MKRASFVTLLIVAVFPAFLQAQATISDTSSLLITSAQGDLTLTPDWAVLEIEVTNRESSAGAAASKNSLLAKRIVDALDAIRGPDDSVGLTGVTIHAQENRDGKLIGYEASATVRVVLRRLDQMGHVLDVAFSTGATGVEDVTFHSDREDASAAEVLRRAFAKAETQAQAMAGSAGLRLGKMTRMSTVPLSGPGLFLQGGVVTAAASYGSLYVPQNIRLSATVYAIWQLEHR